MSDSKFETELLIKAGVKGLEAIAKLGAEIEAAGVDVSELSSKGAILSKTFNDLENQQTLISEFQKLKTQAQSVAEALDKSHANTAKLSKEWKQSESVVREHQSAIEKQSSSLLEQKVAIDNQVQSIKKLGKATKENKDELLKQREALKQQRQAYQAHKKVLAEQKVQYREAVKSARQLAAEQQKSVKETRALKTNQADLNVHLQKTRTAMQQAGLSTKNLARQTQELNEKAESTESSVSELNEEVKKLQQIAKAKVTLGIDADERARNEILAAKQAYETLKNSGLLSSKELARANELHTKKVSQLESQLSRTEPELKKVSSAVSGVNRTLGGFQGLLATLGVSVGAAELIQMADSFKNLEARVKLATGEGANFINGFEGVQEVANKTFSNVEDTGELFARLSKASEQMNLAQKDVLAITETINQAVKLSGGSVESNRAAITQLIQGLQSGVLRGEEFNSVLEQSPRLAQAMADGLGVTVGQLRSMSQEGELTAETVIGSFQEQADVIANEFSTLPATVGNSLIQLKNNIIGFVGEIDQEINSSGGLASVIQGISEGIDDIDPATIDAVKIAFTQLGEIAQQLWHHIETTGEEFQDLLHIFTGMDEANEQVGFFTRTMQGLSIALGVVSDGVAGLSILAKTAFGGMIIQAGYLVKAYETVTGKTSELSDKLLMKGKELFDQAQNQALAFKSSAVQAMDDASKTMQQRLDETAQKSRQAYEQMADDGAASVGKIQEAFVQYAKDAIKANNNVVSERLKAELAEQKLQAAISETGQISVTQATTMQDSVDSQLSSQERLTQKLQKTKLKLKELNDELAKKLVSGDTDSTEFEKLRKEATETEQTLKALQQESVKFGGLLKSDLDKASGAFKNIGLDANEFATGISTTVNSALDSYVEISKLAGDNTDQLARAYAAAQEKLKGNTQAQALLEKKLTQVTEGNKELAAAVKATAAAQKAAKSASQDQEKALDALGISMDAVNSRMSTSGAEMVKTLQTGVSAIKEQSTSAESLGSALTQALDVALPAAKTKADFAAIQQVLEDAGVTSRVTAEQMKLINAGVTGGSKAANKALETTKKQTEALKENTTATTNNVDAKKQQAAASNEAATAQQQTTENVKKSTESLDGMTSSVVAYAHQQVHGLQQIGLTADQTQSIMSTLFDTIVGQRFPSYESYANAIQSLTDNAVNQAKTFARLKTEAAGVAQTLGSAALSSDELSRAQGILRRATTATVNGMIRMDSQTLDNLRSAIDQARQRMQGLANDARNTADSLEVTLLKLKGDDSAARRIEQTKKLTALEDKLREARKRGNSDEIAQLQRALTLQKSINREEEAQAKAREAAEAKRNNAAERSRNLRQSDDISAGDVVGAFERRIAVAEDQAAIKARRDFAKELRDAANTRT